MRLILPLLCLAALVHAAATPDPVVWLPADAAVEVRLPDLARSRQRWLATPYPALLETTWGRVSVGEVRHRLESWMIGACAAIADLGAVAATVSGGGTTPAAYGVSVRGDPVTLRPALAGIFRALPPNADGEAALGEGQAAIHGPVVAWRSQAAPGALARAATPVHDPDADLVASIDPQSWPGSGLGRMRLAVRLDPAGLHETLALEPGAAGAALVAGPTRWADPAELRALPATTLCALTWSADPAAARRVLTALGPEHAGMAAIERACADLALPGFAETLRAADGPCTAWLSEGTPFPTATLALSLPRDLATRWIAAVSARLNLGEAADGARAGFLGLLPIAIGWVDGTPGRLVITSDPQGLEVWRVRKPGFAALPTVRRTLEAVPERCLVLGAGRGGASWSVLAQLAVPLFSGMGNPHVVALPADLRNAGGYGWLKLTVDAKGGLGLDAGGLFGGPLSMAALLGAATPAVLWIQEAQHVDQAPPAEPHVF